MNEWTRTARLRALVATLGVVLLLPAVAVADPTDNWTQWGGPGQDFKAPGAEIAESWGEHGPRQLWSRELGDGYSTILVEDGRLYTMYRAGDQEAVICMDAATGETLWEHRYDHDAHPGHNTQFGVGPRATPLISGDRIYTIGVAGMMHSLEKESGEVVWRHNLWGEEFGGNKQRHGYTSSPIEYGETVIALVGGEDKSIVAFNKADGSVAWQSMSHQASYGSPRILEIHGQDQVVALMRDGLVGADPATGEELWHYAMDSQFQQYINPPTLVDGQYLFLSSVPSGSRGLKLTRREDGKIEVEELWSSRKIRFHQVNSVNDGDWVYGSSGSGSSAFMSAVNVKTGEVAWRKRGFGKANAVYADGRVVVLDENGKLYLTTATPEDLTVHSEVALLNRVAWSAPTIVGSNIYIRDRVKVMALDLTSSRTAEEVMASGEMRASEEEDKAVMAEAEASVPAAEEVAEVAEEDPEAVKILRQVVAAAKAVNSVSYKVTSVPSGIAENFVAAADGDGIIFGKGRRRPQKYRMRVKTAQPGSGEPIEVTGGTDGETFFLIDHLSKKAYADPDPAVMGSGGNALGAVIMGDFVHPAPFDDEINADSAELQGTEEVGGVECHKIHVVYAGGRGESTWFFSTEDLLPRRRIQHFNIPRQGEGSLDITVTELKIEPDIEPGTFAMKLPEGYERIDDFAPFRGRDRPHGRRAIEQMLRRSRAKARSAGD